MTVILNLMKMTVTTLRMSHSLKNKSRDNSGRLVVMENRFVDQWFHCPRYLSKSWWGSLHPQDPLTLEGVRAQVNRHRQRILRLSLLNERLQNYLKARARKKPPLRPPDPQVLSVHVPSSVSSCGSQSLGLFTPDHLSIVISEMSLGKAAPVSGDTGFGKPLDPP